MTRPGPFVVKCGGSERLDRDAIVRDIGLLRERGERVVLVHGGAPAIDDLADQLGVEQHKLQSASGVEARYTDPETLKVVTMALNGVVQPDFLQRMEKAGVPAIGLSGLDAKLLVAERKAPYRALVDGHKVLVRNDRSGRVTEVNSELLEQLMGADLVPVIAPPAVDQEGETVNVNADRVAAAVAAALGARALVLLTAAPGVLADVDDPGSLRTVVPVPRDEAVGEAQSGGMGLKLIAAREVLLEVPGIEVRIADGSTAHPLLDALAGAGSRVVLEEPSSQARPPAA